MKTKRMLQFVLAILAGIIFIGCSNDSDEIKSPQNGNGTKILENGTKKDEPKAYTLKQLQAIDYEMKVIFHVVAPSSSFLNQKITDNRLEDIIEGVNDLYAGKHGGANMKVKFVLADREPNGKTLQEKGIHRMKTDKTSIAFQTVRLDKKGGPYHKEAWNRKEYVNIFVFKFKDDKTYGVSTFPDTSPNYTIDGLNYYHPTNEFYHNACITLNEPVFDNWDAYDPSSNNTVATYVIAHELGHYLGLYHVFKELDPKGDYCDDTREYDRKKYENNLPKLKEEVYRLIYEKNVDQIVAYREFYKRTPLGGGAKFFSTNIMDYYHTYHNKFTEDQFERLRQCLYYCPTLPGPKAVDVVNTRAFSAYSGATYIPKGSICNLK